MHNGVAYTGMGHAECYKLEIKFGQPMNFVTKLDLKHFCPPTAAAFIGLFFEMAQKEVCIDQNNCSIVTVFKQTCPL